MKYTSAIAALLAASNVNEAAAAASFSGCKKGIVGKLYSDSKCEKLAHSTYHFMEKDVEKTGKCNKHDASDDQKAAFRTANIDFNTA